MKCKVDLRGLQIGQQLLQRFFWYEGSIWVLNKINNYSMTTYDDVECEFIKVNEVSNYKNGQIEI
jgi:phage antirepressor YoqD-like protein